MKIKRFNKLSVPGRSLGLPSVRVSKNGCIIFNAAICVRLGLNETTGVEFVQDKENTRDWYFLTSDNEEAFGLRENKSQAGLKMQSMPLANHLLKSVGCELNSFAFPVGVEPAEVEGEYYWPIITASAKS